MRPSVPWSNCVRLFQEAFLKMIAELLLDPAYHAIAQEQKAIKTSQNFPETSEATSKVPKSLIFQISQVSNKSVHPSTIQIHLMSLRRTSIAQPVQTDTLSKRQQRKLEQTLKLFNHSDSKPRKKRKSNEKQIHIILNANSETQRLEQPQPKLDSIENLVETKEQSQFNSTPNRQLATESIKPAYQGQEIMKEGFLNHKYFASEEMELLDFLNGYSYRQMEKTFEKEGKNYDPINCIGEQLIIHYKHSFGILQNLNTLLANYYKEANRRPFSKPHLTVSSAISNPPK